MNLAVAARTGHAAVARRGLSRTTWTLVAILALCGAVLRFLAARGDLWLDEIWTFRQLETIRTPAAIVFALPSDNNHVMNSLWLWLVGPRATPVLVRLLSVLTGSLCVPVAAWAFRREGALASLMAATVFAFDYAFVHFGSEARGYSGLILAVLIAFAALDAMLTDGITRRRQAIFAAAIAFGTFSHLTMVEVTVVLCASGIGTCVARDRTRKSIGSAASILLPAAAGTLPALLCLGISLATGPMHTGLMTPFSLVAFATGFSRMLGATLGLPDTAPGAGCLAVALLVGGAAVAMALAFVPARRRLFYGFALFGVPTLHIALRLPNQQFPRFHLLASIALALLGVDAWTVLRRRAPRLAIGLAACFLVGQAVALLRFIEMGRGHFADAVQRMARGGPTTFEAMPTIQAGETRAVVRWYAGAARLEPAALACGTMPVWLVSATAPYERNSPDEAMILGPAACPARFVRQETFPAYGLSGFTWTLYRRP